jgi:hypothetical protein
VLSSKIPAYYFLASYAEGKKKENKGRRGESIATHVLTAHKNARKRGKEDGDQKVVSNEMVITQ